MRRGLTRIVLAAVTLFVVAALVALLAVYFFVDVDSYREFIEHRAETALGRDVQLGETSVSFFPVFGVRIDDIAIAALPEEGGGTLLEADSLRVGARLWPLLRKRLEVTSIVVDGPSLTVVRDADGRWNVQQLLAPSDGDQAAAALTIDKLRVRKGRLALRDASVAGLPRELTLEKIDLSVDDFAVDRPFGVELSAGIEAAPGARLRFSGKMGPLGGDGTARATGHVAATGLEPQLIDLLAPGALPKGLVGPRPFSVSADVDLAGGDRIDLSDVEFAGAELNLRRRKDGSWNVAASESGGTAGMALRLVRLTTRDVRVIIESDAAGDAASGGSIEDVRLSLAQYPFDGPTPIEAAATLKGEGASAEIALSGTIGPQAAEGLAIDLTLSGADLPLSALGAALPESALDPAKARSSVDLALSGRWPQRVTVKGRAGIRGAIVTLAGLDGGSRRATLDLDTKLDLDVTSGGDAFTLRSVALTFPERPSADPLTITGSLRPVRDGADIDLTVAAPRVSADDLSSLVALAGGDLPFTFTASEPVALRARLSGRVDSQSMPNVEGTATLAGFSVRHASMSAPLEQVFAEAAFTGKGIELTELRGVIGSSDLAGRIAVSLGTPLRIRADIRAKKADVWELLSFIRTDEGGTATTADPGGGFDPMRDALVEGTLAVARGSFHTLTFSELDCGLRFENGLLTISPLATGLYGGSFKGALGQRLDATPVSSSLAGDASGVDVAPFLEANLGIKDVLSGRASGRLDVTTTGAGFEPIVRGLAGSGRIDVRDGNVGRIDVMKSLSRVTGVFGETTLKRVSRQLATSGTAFTSLAAGLTFANGRMTFKDLELVAPEFSLRGVGAVEMLTASLDGQFVVSFVPDVSASMRAEGSRAASVFWNPAAERVEMPFGLKGPADAPQPVIEWKKIAEDKLRQKMSSELERLLGGRSKSASGTPPATTAAPEPGSAQAPAADAGLPATSPATSPDAGAALAPTTESQEPAGTPPASPDPATLGGTIGPPRWSGSRFAQTLQLSGVARGARLARASLDVRDANGIPLLRTERLPAVEEHLRSAADASAPAEVSWQAQVDGKKLLLAKFPLTVTLVITDAAGAKAEVQARVDR